MTRRDLAAMRLAYECVRRHSAGHPARRGGAAHAMLADAMTALWLVRDADSAVNRLAFHVDRSIARHGSAAADDANRLLRARLALLLRAMLREVPRQSRCITCDGIIAHGSDGRRKTWVRSEPTCNGPHEHGPLRYRALWEFASEHRT